MRYIGFDTETTGINPFNDRIVQAAIAVWDDDEKVFEKQWFINPGIEVPKAASDVHGFSTEFLREHGGDRSALVEVANVLLEQYSNGDSVICITNAPFDTTFLNAELNRLGRARIDWDSFLIADSYVLDKAIDKYRKGSRKLVDTAKVWGVEVDESAAHDATYDLYLSVAVVKKILEGRPLGSDQVSREKFMEFQRVHKREQARGLQEYLRRKDPSAIVNGEWPERLA